ADITILLPTRRAVRSFREAFAQVAGGSTLLPRFLALGEVDDEQDGMPIRAGVPVPISRLRRRLMLATLVQRWGAARGRSLSLPQAVAYGESLGAFLNEMQAHHVEFDGLAGLVDETMASHWRESREFLLLLQQQWPKILAEEDAIDPEVHLQLALASLGCALAASSNPVIAAGSTGSIPATADLLVAIAAMPNGSVVLPGLDRELDDQAWSAIALEPGHPQYGLNRLLQRLQIARRDVAEWAACKSNRPREALLRQALRPAPTTDAWYRASEGPLSIFEKGIEGLSVVEASDEREEAQVISLILRQALETSARSAVLVTPDRNLARRVRSEMTRFGIAIDDSAGTPLLSTPSGRFLNLMLDAATANFSPVPLLALLKQPLAFPGEKREAHLRAVRELDLALRGLRPDPGLVGILDQLAELPHLADWFKTLADALSPLEHAMSGPKAGLAELIDAHVEVAQRLSGEASEPCAVWQHEDGEAAFNLLQSLREAARGLPPIDTRSYPALFELHARECQVRRAFGQHPRLAILGPLEARLQGFDVVVLGGLNEGGWPHSAQAHPWLSRPMRKQLGLDQPERGIGLAGHDFFTLAAQPQVFLTRAEKEGGAPTIASRWLQRLQQLAGGLGLLDRLAPATPWLRIAREMRKTELPARARRPAPKPPVSLRPREMRVTEVETWRRDPYAIYARKILNLRKLEPLESAVGPLDRGTLVHKALERYVRECVSQGGAQLSLARLVDIIDELFSEKRIPRSAVAVWRPRMVHAATWFVDQESERRDLVGTSHTEVDGALSLFEGDRGFKLRCRADRIDIMKDSRAVVIDYKTGILPTEGQVKSRLAPQLPLEGAILAAGGFSGLAPLEPGELVYVRLSGGAEPGEWRSLKLDAASESRATLEWLTERIDRFDDPATGYVSRAIPYREDLRGDYDHLARFGEWLEAPSDSAR
ncbi:MAG: double-strand break repair protein AddB, partial [Alphaproteobacteria bacterium]|nr:double-strand break repair protein AddB [Alphaproteobacteria bacterium]